MDPVLKEAIEAKNSLIKSCNTILISTISENNNPNVSYAPTYIDDNCNFYIYISTLAKHTNNMIKTNKISFMIIDENTQNIFAKKRITFNGKIEIIDRKTDLFNQLMDQMKNKLGDTIDMIKHMEDFYLIKIKPVSGLLVHGFAKAFVLHGEGLNEIKHLNDIGHKEK